MARTPGWFTDKIADTLEAARAGDGCHPDEAQALGDYLDGILTTEEPATRITAPILNEADPPQYLFRLWALLCEAIVELSPENRHKTLDLMAKIRALPSACGIQWNQLSGFASMWSTLYKLHLHGPSPWDRWCKDAESYEEYKFNRQREHQVIGRAEAVMFVRGLVITEYSGYRTLNLVCSNEPADLEIYVCEIFGWLDIAGGKLKEKAMSDTSTEKSHRREGTPAEHWNFWKEVISRLGEKESRLCDAERRLATRCHELM